ncbi:recombination-associated protein RdgC [Vogesella sp. LYT5W]|uniref:Recombination-associated protein RdgC n=1 Tax=Vogesella margarita TaxID=2984199 RepID=A0ABT5IRR4_9NEIS|nr:recombination-associated protein RdgC [Vogesella margarita]MDC7714965.1 recombination-associated protein RdgC [Vogesella margarita]
MWFRQLSFYHLPAPEQIVASKLADALTVRQFQRCSGLDWFSEGWGAPAPHLDEPLYVQRERLLLSLRREDKVLPAGVIRDFLDAKLREIEQQELRKVGRKEKLAMKEQITDDLLPRAFTRTSRTAAYFDLARGWLVVDSGSASKAEALLSNLREAMPPLPATLPRTALSPHTLMTDWLAAGEASGDFVLDSDCELKDSSENGAVVRCTRMDLTADEIRQHIATGKQVTRLGLIWRERIRFTLTDTLQLKKLQFLDVLQEEASQAGDDAASLFEATFLLMSEELGELIDDLVQALGGLQDAASPASPVAAPATAAAPAAAAPGAVDVPWD